MITAVLLVLTWLYFALCVACVLRPEVVPFPAIIWGGLILILAWWGHDAAYERRARRANRTREVV